MYRHWAMSSQPSCYSPHRFVVPCEIAKYRYIKALSNFPPTDHTNSYYLPEAFHLIELNRIKITTLSFYIAHFEMTIIKYLPYFRLLVIDCQLIIQEVHFILKFSSIFSFAMHNIKYLTVEIKNTLVL